MCVRAPVSAQRGRVWWAQRCCRKMLVRLASKHNLTQYLHLHCFVNPRPQLSGSVSGIMEARSAQAVSQAKAREAEKAEAERLAKMQVGELVCWSVGWLVW